MLPIKDQQVDLIHFNQYLTCNSTEFLEYLPEDTEPFIDLIVTSPPYWDMKQYGEVEQTGFNQSYEQYLDDIQKTFLNIYKLSKNTATLFVNSDTLKRNGKLIRLPDDIASRLEDIGWIHQDVIIWDKGKTLPWSRKGQMRNTFEYIHIFTKSNEYKYHIDRIKSVDELKEWWIDYPERYSVQGKVPDNIWRYFIPTQGSWGTKKDFGDQEFKHACPFPPEMMARIIKLSSDEGDVIFDPYAGTGTLLATAQNLNRKYLGLDTNPEYKKVFEQVTKPLIDEKMVTINHYYQNQEELKSLLSEVVYKLRILKYPKALIKTLRKALPEELNFSLKASLAIEKEMTVEEEGMKFKIGKVSYFLVSENKISPDIIETINFLVNKAPFTKYGLVTEVSVISVEKAQRILEENNSLYLYTNGIVKQTAGKLTIESAKNVLLNNDFTDNNFEKDIPPIMSNVSIQLKDYDSIPAEKYVKK